MKTELLSGLEILDKLRQLSEHIFKEIKGILLGIGILLIGVFIGGIEKEDIVSLIVPWLRRRQQLGYQWMQVLDQRRVNQPRRYCVRLFSSLMG